MEMPSSVPPHRCLCSSLPFELHKDFHASIDDNSRVENQCPCSVALDSQYIFFSWFGSYLPCLLEGSAGEEFVKHEVVTDEEGPFLARCSLDRWNSTDCHKSCFWAHHGGGK